MLVSHFLLQVYGGTIAGSVETVSAVLYGVETASDASTC